MKKLAGLLSVFLLLCGCSSASSEMERAMALRSRILKAESCRFETEITADYGDSIQTFSLSCEADSEGELTFCVTSPESIAGITGEIDDDGGRLTFDETALHFELLADDQVSPIAAPWIFLKTLRSGFLTSACIEDGMVRLTAEDSFDEDALQLDIWLDEGDLPKRAEILFAGRRILSLDIKRFEIM